MLAAHVAEVIAVLVGLAGVFLLSLYVRRRVLQRGGGTIDLSLRPGVDEDGRGWVLGVGRFDGDTLAWYRVFSLSMRPRRRLSRRNLAVVDRREPRSEERRSLLSGAVVLRCQTRDVEVELAMSRSATTGFLAWLEATAPGATLPS
ncbi:MAG: DUF2550 domain-containing protein [Mycobacteriales bacterium]